MVDTTKSSDRNSNFLTRQEILSLDSIGEEENDINDNHENNANTAFMDGYYSDQPPSSMI